MVRREDSELIWQRPVVLHLPSYALGAQRVDLPTGQMAPGRYVVLWQLDDAADAEMVRTNLEYSPMDLAQLASLLKPATVQDVLAKLNCPLPKDPADRALVRVRIDRLVERVQAELARKDATLTARIAASYRQILQVVDPLRSGKGYSSAQRGWFEAAFYSPVDGSAQPYALFVPKDYDSDPRKRYPLVVHLHGSGGSHTRDIGMTLDVTDAFILNVLGRGPTYGYREISADEVVREVHEVMSRYRIDPDAVHLRGHSLGGGGTFLVGSTYPDLFATARPLCGCSSGMPVEQMVNLPTFVHHGLADRGIDPVCSIAAVARMQQVGCPVQLYLYPGVGHNVGPAANKVARWDTFKDIRRDLQPRTVVLTGGIPALKKAYWLTILRYNDVHEETSLGATFVQQNHLVLDATNVAWLKIALPCKWVDPQKVLQISDATGYRWTELTPGEAKAIYVHVIDGKLEAATEPAIDFEDPAVYTDGGVPFMFWLGRPIRVVYGTAGSAQQIAATEELLLQLRRWSWLGGKEMETGGLPALKDSDVDEQILKTCDLILLGTPQDNTLLAKMAKALPVRYDGSEVSVDGEPSLSWAADDVLLSLYYRNPLSPQRRVWWFGGSHDRKTLQATVDISRYATFGRMAPELIVLDRKSRQVVATASIQADWKLARTGPTKPVASVWASPAELARNYAQAMRDAFGAGISVVEPFHSADPFAWNRLAAGDLMRALPSQELIVVSLQGSELQHWRETYTVRGNNAAKADDIPWAGMDPQALEADATYDVLLQPDMAMADSMQRSGISLAKARLIPASQVQTAKDRFLRSKGLLPRAAAPDPARAADGSTVSSRQSPRR